MHDSPPRYQIPTHLNVPDKLDFPLLGITVSLTLRQGVCVLVGGALAFWVYQHLVWLTGPFAWLHGTLPVLMLSLTAIVAVHQFRGRHLEVWLLILLAYALRSKIWLWRPVDWLSRRDPELLKEEPLS